MARRKKAKQFKVGHIVRHTREFLRNTGQFVGAPINGRVEALRPFGREYWPVVLWSDADEPRLVNPANLELDPRARRINAQVGLRGFGRPWKRWSSCGGFGTIEAPSRFYYTDPRFEDLGIYLESIGPRRETVIYETREGYPPIRSTMNLHSLETMLKRGLIRYDPEVDV